MNEVTTMRVIRVARKVYKYMAVLGRPSNAGPRDSEVVAGGAGLPVELGDRPVVVEDIPLSSVSCRSFVTKVVS